MDAESLSGLDLLCSLIVWFFRRPTPLSSLLLADIIWTPPDSLSIMQAQAAPEILGPVYQEQWGTLPPLHCQSNPGFACLTVFLGTG